MTSRRLVAVLIVLIAPGAARADAGVPGFKRLRVYVVVDNVSDYPDYAFYLAPTIWLPGPGPDKPKKPIPVTPGAQGYLDYPIRHYHDWVMLAVPRTRADAMTWEMLAADQSGVLRSNRVDNPGAGDRFFLSPRDFRTIHFRIDLVGDRLMLTAGPVEDGSDGFHSCVPAVVATLAVVGFGLLVARWMRRPRR